MELLRCKYCDEPGRHVNSQGQSVESANIHYDCGSRAKPDSVIFKRSAQCRTIADLKAKVRRGEDFYQAVTTHHLVGLMEAKRILGHMTDRRNGTPPVDLLKVHHRVADAHNHIDAAYRAYHGKPVD